MKQSKVKFSGTILTVKARIRLLRSFDQIPTHQYQGYTLVLAGEVAREDRKLFRVGIGPKAHETHRFQIGDEVSGFAHPVDDPETEWAEFYRVSSLKLISRKEIENQLPGPGGGVAPSLDVYRTQGHLRLRKQTCETECFCCPFGLTMATQIIVDHWDPRNFKWRFETHCYGPRDCPRYKSGPAYRVPGRRGMVYVDNDVERFRSGEY